MPSPNYLHLLNRCRSPGLAATYIRAFEATLSSIANSDRDIVQQLREAEQHAQQLERLWRANDEDEARPVPLHIMRQWLREWGYM